MDVCSGCLDIFRCWMAHKGLMLGAKSTCVSCGSEHTVTQTDPFLQVSTILVVSQETGL